MLNRCFIDIKFVIFKHYNYDLKGFGYQFLINDRLSQLRTKLSENSRTDGPMGFKYTKQNQLYIIGNLKVSKSTSIRDLFNHIFVLLHSTFFETDKVKQ